MNPQNPTATRRQEKAKKYLRLFLRDTPQLNRLINKEESNEELMQFALDMAIDDWNSTTPVIGRYTIENFPSLYLLMHSATIVILKSQGLYQARNELQYNTGGSSFIRSNKSNYYLTWLTNFSSEFELKKRNLKIQYNINRGWGGVNSEYDIIGFWW